MSDKTEDHLSKLGESKSVAVNEGDLIMSIEASVGISIIVKTKACIHDGFVAFTKLSETVDVEFLYYLLNSMESKFSNMGQHGTQSNITTEMVSMIYIPKPLLQEQQKIASILSNIENGIQKQRTYKLLIEKLKKGLMQKLLTGQIRVKL